MGWWPSWSQSSDADKTNDLGLSQDLKEYLKNPDQAEQPRPAIVRDGQVKTATGQRERTKTLRQIAMDNCVEYERAYSRCLRSGPMWERIQSCPGPQAMHEQCKEMQEYALTVLGFKNAADDDAKVRIKALADDLMIQNAPSLVITEGQLDAFYKAVDALKSP